MTDRPALHSVAVIVQEDFSPFELAIACEVFGVDRTPEGLPEFVLSICAEQRGPIRAGGGFQLIADHDLTPVESADLVMVTPSGNAAPSPAVAAALHRAIERGARVASMCSAAFALAHAGLLDGRRATTHWFHEEEFRLTFPDVELLTDVLYVEDGPIITSAGTAAGIDMCLHLVRQAHGAEAANGIGRRMVVAPQRDGGQAQFVRTPVREDPAQTLAPVLDWAAERLDEDLSVARLAGQALMSERTFARRFRDETGTTPHQWVQRQRVALAERLLEGGRLGIEEVARRCGFGSAAMLRHHFGRHRRVAPAAYRRTFGQPV